MAKFIRNLNLTLICYIPSCAWADVKLQDAVNTLLIGGDVLTKVMWAACIIVGIALIAAGFTQFQIHRRNPKLVPLTTPIMYLILGVAAISLPFIDTINDFISPKHIGLKTGPAKSHNRGVNSAPAPSNPNDIDAPIN